MRTIPVFRAEVEAGVAEAVQASASVAYLSPIVRLRDPAPSHVQAAEAAAGGKVEDATLIYFEDVLATSGWNLNRDVFTAEELWSARHTSDHKPINMRHKYVEIVGHVLGSQAVDADYAPIADDAALEDLPGLFHVKNRSVLYRYIGDQDRDELMAAVEREIEEGKWFVSMEAFFNGFDYGVWSEDDGSRTIVKRDSTTAFLTKHLWQYGGDGSYTDPASGRVFNLGRVLKGVHFKGKGLVEKPGNAHSVIFAKTEAFDHTYASLGYVHATGSEEAPPDHQQETEPVTEPSTDDKAAEIEKLRAEVEALKGAQASQAIDELKAKVAELQASLDSEKARAEKAEADRLAAKAQADTFESTLKEQGEKLAEAEKRLEEKSTALAGFEAEKRKADRIAYIRSQGGGEAQADKLAADLAVLDDETFRSTIAAVSPSWTPKPAAEASRAEVEKQAIDEAEIEAGGDVAKASQEAPPAADPADQAKKGLIALFTINR